MNSRTQTLAQLNTVMAAYNAYNTVMGTGSSNNPDTPTTAVGPTAAFTVGASYGTSQSSSTSAQRSATSTQGQALAGGNITFKATGAGADSNLTLQGQTVQAGGKVTLAADNQIKLLAAQSTASQQSSNKSSGSAVGATWAMGGNQNGPSFQASATKRWATATKDCPAFGSRRRRSTDACKHSRD